MTNSHLDYLNSIISKNYLFNDASINENDKENNSENKQMSLFNYSFSFNTHNHVVSPQTYTFIYHNLNRSQYIINLKNSLKRSPTTFNF